MNRKWMKNLMLVLPLVAVLGFTGCSDDGDDDGMTGPTTTGNTFMVTIENVSSPGEFSVSGVFNTPVGANQPGPVVPGSAYQFHFGANPGQKLHFATMMVESNDLFYAPMNGLALYNGDTPIEGDVTDQIYLWDAGTEANQEPGEGADQPLRQAGANTGAADSNSNVRLVNDQWTYPSVEDVLQVTLDYLGGHEFTLTIENVSEVGTIVTSQGTELPVPIAPGVFVVNSEDDALFAAGSADYGMGLEGIAEDGNPSDLGDYVAGETMIAVPLAPGAFAVHSDAMPLFSQGEAERGNGLEALAEDGNPAMLEANLMADADVMTAGVFNTPDGAMDPAPIFPGESYSFEFEAEPGYKLSFATMFVMSNDLFYGTDDDGLALFDASDMPRSGDITQYVQLWDAGTEMNEWPGVGPNQAPFQTAGDTGDADDTNTVRMVDDMYMYPSTGSVVKVTLTVVN